MKVSSFFSNDYVDQASYDNLRKIGSLVDGQKNASRKILYTILAKNIKEKIKVSQLGSKVAEFAEYLHGNLDGVIVNLGQDYTGTNNIPLLQKKGNFGTRFSQEASASRYIYTYGSKEFFDLFKREDSAILKHQSFEGQAIEPMFFVPTLPILLVNGSEGVSSGFSQKILPRDPEQLKEYIRARLANKKYTKPLVPFYKGFKGTIESGEHPGQWQIRGVATVAGLTRVDITEVPVGYDLKGYIKVLDDLEEKKVIQSYKDLSEDDNFKFTVTIPSKVLKNWTQEELLKKLKLIKTVTENYTVIDENNKICVYTSPEEILDHYIRVKLEYLELRKAHQIEVLSNEILLDASKYVFIGLIVDDKLTISKRKKADIVAELDTIEDIHPDNGSYDYLLNMNILSLTEERLAKLVADLTAKANQVEELSNTTVINIWTNEL